MRIQRLASLLGIGSLAALLSSCQSVSDALTYGIGFDPNQTVAITGHNPPSQSSSSRRAPQRTTEQKPQRIPARGTHTEVTPSGMIIERDNYGNIVRTGSTFEGTTTYRNTDGQITSRVSTTDQGSVERDASGSIVSTSSTSVDGSTTTYRDGNGLIIGTKYVSPAGNVTYRDGDGRITGPDFQ